MRQQCNILERKAQVTFTGYNGDVTDTATLHCVSVQSVVVLVQGSSPKQLNLNHSERGVSNEKLLFVANVLSEIV